MNNKRELKRVINYIFSNLFAEGVVASFYATNTAKEDVESLLGSILALHNDFICRVSHPEPGIPAKQYYKKLTNDVNKKVSELIDRISSLS